MSRFADLRRQLWWTDADESEFDLLTHELVKAVRAHREGCRICSQGGPWCVALTDGFDAVLEWREGRVLRSKAAWLRMRQAHTEELAV